jgi:hypothetical protein
MPTASCYRRVVAYEHDVFVSFRHHAAVSEWVHEHFLPLLTRWLEAELPHECRVFIDDEIETGDAWPERLERALKHSALLIPVLSTGYFYSSWCVAEFMSMYERERLCSLRTQDNPSGLIWPLRFNEGEHFSQEAQNIQQLHVRRWAFSARAFSQSLEYVELESAVHALATSLARALQEAPEWQADWPIERPSPSTPPPISVPRI